jgi:hypothetical protein
LHSGKTLNRENRERPFGRAKRGGTVAAPLAKPAVRGWGPVAQAAPALRFAHFAVSDFSAEAGR